MSSLGLSSRFLSAAQPSLAHSTYSRRQRFSTRLRTKDFCAVHPKEAYASGSGLGKHIALLSAFGPFMLAAPAYAQLESLSANALADSVTIPFILSSLAGGAVFAALQSKETKDVMALVAEGARTEKPPQRFAESSSPLVQGLEEPMAAAKDALDHAVAQLPTEDLSHSQSSPASPLPASSSSLAEPETSDDTPDEEAAEPLTQLAALTSEEASASNQVMVADKKASQAAEQIMAATMQPAQETSIPSVLLVATNSVEASPIKKKSSYAENIFDLAVETRRRMQAEYERKMMVIRQDTAQKQADEAKRQQQRSAQISRLQSATESQAARERIEAARQEHPMSPFSHLLALLMSVWAWVQRQVSRLTNRSGSGSSAASAA